MIRAVNLTRNVKEVLLPTGWPVDNRSSISEQKCPCCDDILWLLLHPERKPHFYDLKFKEKKFILVPSRNFVNFN